MCSLACGAIGPRTGPVHGCTQMFQWDQTASSSSHPLVLSRAPLSPPHLARVTRPSGGGAAASEPRAAESACRAAQARRVRTRSRAGRRGAAGHERGLEQRGVAGHGDEAGRDRRSGARCGHARRNKNHGSDRLDCFFPVKLLASYSIQEERGGAIPPIQSLKSVSFPPFFIRTNFL